MLKKALTLVDTMSKANEVLKQMMEDPTGEMSCPVRKTKLFPQPDGSIVQQITDIWA